MSIVFLRHDEAALDEQLTIHATLDSCNTTGVNEQRNSTLPLVVGHSIGFRIEEGTDETFLLTKKSPVRNSRDCLAWRLLLDGN